MSYLLIWFYLISSQLIVETITTENSTLQTTTILTTTINPSTDESNGNESVTINSTIGPQFKNSVDNFGKKLTVNIDKSIAIIFTGNCSNHCGGVFIGPAIIITTSSCVKLGSRNVRVYPNIDNYLPECHWDQIPYPIFRIINYTNFHRSSDKINGNLALIVLFNSIDQYVEPVKLLNGNVTISQQLLYSHRELPTKLFTFLWPTINSTNHSNHHHYQDDNNNTNSLSTINSMKKISTRLIEHETCSLFKTNLTPIDTICGYYDLEKANCYDQEGFPIIYSQQSVNPLELNYYLMGLIGHNSCEMKKTELCPPSITLYLNLTNYLPWIFKIFSIYQPLEPIKSIKSDNPVNIVYNVHYNSHNGNLHLLDSHDKVTNTNISSINNNQRYNLTSDSHNILNDLSNLINATGSFNNLPVNSYNSNESNSILINQTITQDNSSHVNNMENHINQNQNVIHNDSNSNQQNTNNDNNSNQQNHNENDNNQQSNSNNTDNNNNSNDNQQEINNQQSNNNQQINNNSISNDVIKETDQSQVININFPKQVDNQINDSNIETTTQSSEVSESTIENQSTTTIGIDNNNNNNNNNNQGISDSPTNQDDNNNKKNDDGLQVTINNGNNQKDDGDNQRPRVNHEHFWNQVRQWPIQVLQSLKFRTRAPND